MHLLAPASLTLALFAATFAAPLQESEDVSTVGDEVPGAVEQPEPLVGLVKRAGPQQSNANNNNGFNGWRCGSKYRCLHVVIALLGVVQLARLGLS